MVISVLYSTVHFHYYGTINTVATGFNGVKGIVHTKLLYIIIYKRLDSLQVSLINLHDDGNTALHMSIYYHAWKNLTLQSVALEARPMK